MIRCSIVGATGYTGIELARILLNHPRVQISSLTSRQEEPPELFKLLPELPKNSPLAITKFDFKKVVNESDVIFCCLPHTESAELVGDLDRYDKIVIDLSADFRLKNAKLYKAWYGVKHPRESLLKKAVYGLPEIYRDEIVNASLIANPGCYPTATLLALYPLLAGKLIRTEGIVVDAKSGVSGAGKKAKLETFVGEVNENFKAYKVNKHQHMPEIQMVLDDVAGSKAGLTFVPHLLPLERGILATVYATKKKGVKAKAVREAYLKKYGNEPFVRIRKEGEFPSLHEVQHTNFCDIGLWAEDRSDRVIVISAIDNLVKGASGQAVQNMNIRLGLPEQSGFERIG